ncbi:MAG: GNAT family N-acetyltransferase [Deltaproteobacteria bacterium]|nr:MAG: GNAT family N-acetyltransferase [Deltaproteobacteria bacterium]TMQ12807.1 MAG: GNAT family N-acetyltransferase [Deltaproteobacteria bacterium]
MDTELEIVTIASHDDEGLLDEFHGGVYWDAFADQQEPVEVWKRALWGGAVPYELTIRIAGRALRDRARREIAGGIAFERYPRSGCGLVTYMVIAPTAQRHGLGRRLQREAAMALFAAGAPAVFGEVNDPRLAGRGVDEPLEAMWRRLERNQAWGARVVDARYVQPALAPGLGRDHGLCLIALAGAQPLPSTMPGTTVRDFVAELYAVTEGGEPDADLVAGIPEHVDLIELRR